MYDEISKLLSKEVFCTSDDNNVEPVAKNIFIVFIAFIKEGKIKYNKQKILKVSS